MFSSELTMKLTDSLHDKDLFDIFCSKQEYDSKKDEYGRFIHKFSSYKNIEYPVVSNYLLKNGLQIQWPEKTKFAACLTHDVDTIYPSWKYTLFTASKLALKMKTKKSLERMASKLGNNNRRNPYWNFKKTLELEKQYDAKSTFYFLAATDDLSGTVYNVEDLTAELDIISEMGGEVGLHGGFYSYNNIEKLREEKERLEKASGRKAIGIRMHYLRFSVPYTWRLIADLGFKYDATFGYPDMPGFRNGMCHPFKPYDLIAKDSVDVLEIPLTVMDNSLYRMGPDEAWFKVQKLVEAVEKNNGVITILWHNNTFDEVFAGEWARMYEKILQLLKEKKAWMTNGAEICDYWTKNTPFS